MIPEGSRLITGAEEAIVGYYDLPNGARSVIYSYELMVSCIKVKQSLTRDEAVEHIDFNILGSLGEPGEGWPTIMYAATLEDIMTWEDG